MTVEVVIMDKNSAIARAMAAINKAYGDGTIIRVGDAPEAAVATVSTGAATLDLALGVGGIPRGRITEIFGPEAAGKTTLSLSVIANVQRGGGTAAYIDAEHSLDLHYARTIGVNTDDLLLLQPDSAEQALEGAETLVRAGVDCVVLDSVAALVPQAEIDGEMKDFQVGLQARLMGKACRKLVAPVADAGCVFIFINQLREKVGSYGNPYVTPGGRALKHYASIRIEVAKVGQPIKSGEHVQGVSVLAKVIKNKVAPPSTQAMFDIIFAEGIDYVATLLDAGKIRDLLDLSGNWISYKGTRLGNGRTASVAFLKENPSLLADLEASVHADR